MKMRLLTILALLLALCVPAAAGAYENRLEIFNLDNNETVDIIEESGTYAAYGRSTDNGIKIVNGADVVLFLDGVSVSTDWDVPLDCTNAGSVTLVLIDGTQNTFVNSVDSMGSAGIWNADVPLTICCESVYDKVEGHVCDDSCGALDAIGGTSWGAASGAGIGGCMEFEAPTSVAEGEEVRGAQGSNITILGGNIFAQGGDGSAGIGGGNSIVGGYYDNIDGEWSWRNEYCAGNGTNIKIAGGNVEAVGGDGAAGIGGAMNLGLTDRRNIGRVEDYRGGNGTNITISGGQVQAYGGMMAPAIGGGYLGQGKNITISGGTLYAEACTMPSYENDADDEMPVFAPVGSGVTFPEDDVTPAASGIAIAPKSGKRIVAKVDDPETGDPVALEGSPFTSRKDVTRKLEGHFILATMEEDAPAANLPATGDRSKVMLWAALFAMSAAAAFAFRRKAA